MNYSDISFSINDTGVATITLNRPDVLNSFRPQMSAEFQQALAECEQNNEVRVVVVTGAGRAFCAGQDLSALNYDDGNTPELEAIVRETYNPLIMAIRSLPKPVIAFVNGVAAGAGANLAFVCDIVIARQSAVFVQAFGQVGLIPDSGGTYMLPRLIGEAKAKALMITGEKVTAPQAEELGMVYKAVADEECEDFVGTLAERLAKGATKSIAFVKQALDASWNNTLEQQLDLEAVLQGKAGNSKDHKEGVQAFLEKRPAKFIGS